MNNPSSSQSHNTTPRYRPASIAELAEEAQSPSWDPSKGLKHWVRAAGKARTAGKKFQDGHDYESAFVEYTRAASIVIEKLPTYDEYYTQLSAEQRHNLGLNGQDILDRMSKLKPLLVRKYKDWCTTAGASSEPTETRSQALRRRQEEERLRHGREHDHERRRDSVSRRQSVGGRVSGDIIRQPYTDLKLRREDTPTATEQRRGSSSRPRPAPVSVSHPGPPANPELQSWLNTPLSPVSPGFLGWGVTPTQKARSDMFFDTLDPWGTGYVEDDAAAEFFQKSGLPLDVLRQIWGLADGDDDDKLSREEFAVAMHLVKEKLSGKDLPNSLPFSLIPPSARQAMDSFVTARNGPEAMRDPMATAEVSAAASRPSEEFLEPDILSPPPPYTDIYQTPDDLTLDSLRV